MEFRPQDIARLVLGYLKGQKYDIAYKELLNNCPYFKHLTNNGRNKSIVTRMFGLSLTDYLSEYECIYNIIQEQLENTDYFKENGSRTTLVVQLVYLLNSKASFESRTSTPIQDENHINKQTNSHNPRDNLSQSLERIEALATSSNKSSSLIEAQNETSQEEFEEIFTQTFLQNSELIERLADNINKEVSSKSLLVEDTDNFNIGHELDKNKIDTIVERIESDPVFVKLFDDITSVRPEDEAPVSENFIVTTDLEQQFFTSPRKVNRSILSSDESIKKCLRSSKKSLPVLDRNSIIEDQNNAAIQSIIAASSCNDDKIVTQESNCAVQVVESVNDNNYDNVLHPPALLNQGSTIGSTNQMYVNTGGGCFLMLQNSSIAPAPNLLPSSNLQVDAPKPYYFIGQPPIINSKPSATPLKFNSQDILNVPTLIMCETNQISNTSTIVIPPVNVLQNESEENYQSVSEYLTLYKCNDSFASTNSQPQVEPSPKHKPRKKIKRLLPKRAGSPPKSFQDNHTTSTATNVIIEVNTKEALITIPELKPLDVPSNHINSMPAIGTPKNNVEISKVGKSRSTPRNGSHIRQLNFSTPEKWCAENRRPNTSPKAIKNLNANDTPMKSTNRDATKCRRTSLFATDIKEKTVEKSSKNQKQSKINAANKDHKEEKTSNSVQLNSNFQPSSSKPKKQKSNTVGRSWDAHLRVSAGVPDSTTEKITRKRKTDEKLKGKKPKRRATSENINSTEEDVAKFESALADIGTNIEDAEIIIPGLIERNESFQMGDVIVLGSEQECGNDTNKIPINEESREVEPICNQTKANEELVEDLRSENKVDEKTKPLIVNIAPVRELIVTEAIKKDIKLDAYNSLNVPLTVDTSYQAENLFTRNRNVKSKTKKKCNMSNVAQCSQSSDEIVLTHITKIKSCENLNENNKLILSPSKLNANKRNLLQVEHRPISSDTKSASSEKTEKFVTPELIQVSANMPQLGAKRDISSLLETPFKSELATPCPKTPGNCASPLINTPFTQAVIEQLTEMDICTIPTPKFPITPNFPFTPAIAMSEKSSFSNRPTDYSTSSSYYQPSDTEQNKSIEQLIEETKRLEKQGFIVNDDTKQKCAKDEPVHKVASADSIREKMKEFNSSIIGRKNLYLIKDDEKEVADMSSISSSSSSSSCTSSDESDTTFSVDNSPATVVKESPYSLRSSKRNAIKSKDEKKEAQNSSAESDITRLNKPKPKSNKLVKLEVGSKLESSDLKKKENSNVIKNLERQDATKTNKLKLEKRVESIKKLEVKKSVNKKPEVTQLEVKQQRNVTVPERTQRTACINHLVELEQKRQRTIEKFKSNDCSSKSKAPVKRLGKCGRRINMIKPKDKGIVKKTKPLVKMNTEKQTDLNLSKSNEEPVLLHLSSDDSLLKSMEISEEASLTNRPNPTEEQNEESNDTVDKEAETLVNGLRQWGIHLVHNKKLKQKSDETPTPPIITIPERQVKRDTHDVSLEEGEILSNSSREEGNSKSINEVDNEVQFDLKNLSQETRITYGDYKNAKRKPVKCNSEILTKTFSANIYISEIDAETEIILSVSPMEFLLDLPSKSNSEGNSKVKRKTINILSDQVIKMPKSKCDEKLEKNAIKKSLTMNKSSKKREDTKIKKVFDKPSEVNKKAKSIQVSNDEKVLKKSTDEILVQKSLKKSEESKSKSRSSLKPLEDKRSRRSQSIEEKPDCVEKLVSLKEDMNVVIGSEKSSSMEIVEENVTDDLMNYALIGSERVPESEEELLIDAKKRKRSDSTSNKQGNKKNKDENFKELLKNTDVDSFLKQLHGEK